MACIEQANGRSASLLGTALALAEPCVAGNISMFGGCSRYIYIYSRFRCRSQNPVIGQINSGEFADAICRASTHSTS